MATITWTGQAHDGLFSDANNWAGNILPGTADVAIIAPGTATTVTSSTNTGVGQLAIAANVTFDLNSFTGFSLVNGTNGSGIAGTVNIANGAVLNLDGVVTNSGTINAQSTGNNTEITLGQNTTLTGGGHVVLSGSSGTNFIFGNLATFILTNLNNTISGGGTIGDNQMGFVNAGTVNADVSGTLLVVDPNNNTTNTGVMEASNGGTLELLNYTVSNSSGAIGGTVEAVGAGSTLLLQTTLAGRTITAAGGGTIESNGAVLNGQPLHPVTVNGAIQVLNGQSRFLAGNIINNSSINLNAASSNTSLRANSPIVTLNGTGSVNLLGASPNNVIEGSQQYYQLVNHSNTITGSGNLGANSMTLVNQAAGVINANSTSTLTLETAGEIMLNQGLIVSANTGDLLIIRTPIQNSGTGTLRATGAGSQVLLEASVINAGTLSTASGGLIATTTSSASELDGFSAGALTIAGGSTVQVTDGTKLELAGTINNAGTISVNSTNDATQLLVNSYSVALTGGGRVALSNFSNLILSGSAAFRLTNVNNTIAAPGTSATAAAAPLCS
jgi:hypothetical protein